MSNSGSSTLGLTKVVLYKHGIGYFERRGKVTGPTSINLVCEASEIDDMLKSLLALSEGGGRIDAVTYDSSKTLESRLAEFGFDISQSEGLIGLLAQMKGIPVIVTASGETISGRILGLDTSKSISTDNHTVEELSLTLYTGGSSFKRISLTSISDIKVEDEAMASELKQQLELLFQNAKKKDRKALKVSISDPGEQQLLIAYSIPCPIWKTSYRLVMNAKDKVLLQGMAIVDNVQEEDWNAVQIVLVSASPISFIQPLYDPVQPSRQRIAAQGNISSGPVVAERAMQPRVMMKAKMMRNEPAAAPAAMMVAGSAGGDWGAGAAFDQQSISSGLEESFAAELNVDATGTGEMFEYRITQPVTVPRNSSALIPIVQQDIKGQRISLYNESKNAKFPYSAVKFHNSTGLTLEGGPVTVMEGDIYAGEALLDTVKPDDSRYLLYAVDQACPFVIRNDSVARPYWRVRSYGGWLYLDYRRVNEKTYQIDNLSEREKVVYVEHPFSQNWNIVSEPKPEETTANFYRFRLELEAKKSFDLVVKEESESQEQIFVMNPGQLDRDRIKWLCAQNFVDREFIDFLKKLMSKRDEILQIQEETQQLTAQRNQYQEDQARARENLKTLGANTERYRKIIDQTEDQITEINTRIQELSRQLALKQREYQEIASAKMSSDLDSAAKNNK